MVDYHFFVYLGYGAVAGLLVWPQPRSLDTLLFQATMPSISFHGAFRPVDRSAPQKNIE